MKKIKYILFMIVAVCIVYGFVPNSEKPYIKVSLNRDVYRGQPLYINLLTTPADKYIFEWQKKSYSATPECADKKSCSIEFLFPTEYDSHGIFELKITLKTSDGDFESVVNVNVHDKDYKKESLKVDSKYVQLPNDVLKRIEEERVVVSGLLKTNTGKRMWSLPFTHPVEVFHITGEYGDLRLFNGEPRNKHGGLDLRAKTGENIYAIDNGTVIFSGDHYFSGRTVYVDHGLGVVSIYMHLSEYNVSAGEVVKKGDLVGKAGATGRVTGPHLHLSLIVQGTGVDPVPLF